ncbi:MAG: enoyl-CoA hydratase/isomerase family protein [Notoacmeibacter sp.]|nr:enoyl-CoA hydratase/isomerase family protein [Notoacmeibacter sp.]MCC0031951.1 enoyl-CoA hydratase/isomerase family protein [Brucellaceae bacterium]
MPVSVETRGPVALVTISNPPVNAIGQAERQGLLDALARIEADGSLRAAVIRGEGANFAAGADAREFDGPALDPQLPDVLNAIEACAKPWIAAIEGAALGGGLEIALVCDRRIVHPRATLGLPETNLGIVPGSGGTQRLPRLVGMAAALDMIPLGTPVRADKALAIGLADELSDDPLTRALELAGADTPPAKRQVSRMESPAPEAEALEAAEAAVARKKAGQLAPRRAIELIALSAGTDFAEGAAEERKSFLSLRTGSQARALRHMFFAERGARAPAHIAELPVPDITRAAVIGGGTMGAGIAWALLQAGIAVTLVEAMDSAVERATHNVGKLAAEAEKRGLLTPEKRAALMGQIRLQVGYEGLDDCALAIEAAYESMEVKRQVFSALDAALPKGAVLATNTSYLDINEIAAVVSRPEAVVGLHFFSPAHVMKLLEIVQADKTAPEALALAYAVAKRLKKIPVLSGVCDGFIGNRILARYREIADMVMIDGSLPWEIDEAMVEFGYAMGPYMTQDLAGLDIAFANRKRQAATRDPNRRYVPIGDRMVEEGRLGRKASVGWYRYPGGGGAVIDPLLEDMITEEARHAKITRREFSHDEICRRLLAGMINEAAAILQEGIAENATAIDLVTVNGYGFPRWRGGLMHHAAEYGFDRVIADIEEFAREDAVVWQVSQGLRALAAKA